MRLWRIAKRDYADLSGRGGLHGPGRWHREGRLIVYTAEHPALAQFEVRVHMDVQPRFLSNYVLMQIGVPETISIHEIAHSDLDITDQAECQKFGTRWLEENTSALLKVPSVIVPESWNYLLNPMHPDARSAEIESEIPFNMDKRLFV